MALSLAATIRRFGLPVLLLWFAAAGFNSLVRNSATFDETAHLPAGLTYLELVVAPLREPRDGSYALRLHGVWRDVDYSVMGGIFEEAPTVGVDLASNLGDAAVRLEAVFASPVREVWKLGTPSPEAPSDYWQLVLSIDYLFDVGNGVYTMLEHLYNGNALGFGSGLAGGLLPFFGQTTRPTPGNARARKNFVRSATTLRTSCCW